MTMGFKEIIQRAKERKQEKKEMFKQMQNQDRMQELLEERKKSANLRELERYMKEEQEGEIKTQLEYMRKKRDQDIKFGHNPLDTPNITKDAKWKVLKEKNMFKGKSNMFVNQPFIHKSDNKLLKNNRSLYGL